MIARPRELDPRIVEISRGVGRAVQVYPDPIDLVVQGGDRVEQHFLAADDGRH